MANKLKRELKRAHELLAETLDFLANADFDFENGVISPEGLDEGHIKGNEALLRLTTDIELHLRGEEFHLGPEPEE